jgi:PIN domain nuclease of toxin-antitoxin system
MKYLIDTHILLWIISTDSRLSKRVEKIYLNGENDVFISIASLWEISIKLSLKKLTIDSSYKEFVQTHIIGNDIKILNITLSHIFRVNQLPFHHRDPFDRMIIAQGVEDNIMIISSDPTFDKYPIKRIF